MAWEQGFRSQKEAVTEIQGAWRFSWARQEDIFSLTENNGDLLHRVLARGDDLAEGAKLAVRDVRWNQVVLYHYQRRLVIEL